MSKSILITGGMGFIGTNLVEYLHRQSPSDRIVVFDCMTYASRPSLLDPSLYQLENVDIRDQASLTRAIQKRQPTHVYHLAAESHVCRSIAGPRDFMQTNIIGTWNLMEELRHYGKAHRIIHVSTDEVFGEIEHPGRFTEMSQISPRSPYAASKASSDHIALAYATTYQMPIIVTNCSNNFGPNQHEEKLIPGTIKRLLSGLPATIYGDGNQVRDWLYVEDHCEALELLMTHGYIGERYCIGGDDEMRNYRMVCEIADSISRVTGKTLMWSEEYVNSRPTDDKRYAIDTTRIKKHTGWRPKPHRFRERLDYTVRWYCESMGLGTRGAMASHRHTEAEATQ